MQTLSTVSFITEPRIGFRAASNSRNEVIGSFSATSIVFAQKFGEWDEATIELTTPLAWALGCLPQKTGGDVSTRARYVTVTPPSGEMTTLLIDECDISEVDDNTASVTIKAYSAERWLDLVPSSVSDANTDYSISQQYSDVISRILTTYSTGHAEEQINGVPFRDLPILPFDAAYTPTEYEKETYGVTTGNSAVSPVDGKPAARIASVDTDSGFPEPQGEKLQNLMKAFPYALADVDGGQRVEYRQDFDYILIPADSPYGDGCLWWRWAFRPRVKTARYFSRSNGAISADATMHASMESGKIFYLPDDKDGAHRRSTIGFGGTLYPGVWASTSVAQANASGKSASDLTASDAAALAASAASSIKPITIDISANGDFSDVRPGMAASVRFSSSAVTMLVNEVDFAYDSDAGWSAKIPVTSKTSSIDYIFVPKPETTKPADPSVPPVDVGAGGITWPSENVPGFPELPGLPGDTTPSIPTPPVPDPWDGSYPDDGGSGSNTKPVDLEIVEEVGDNAGRSSIIRTKDGRIYAVSTDEKNGSSAPYFAPEIRKVQDIPESARLVSPFSLSAASKDGDDYRLYADAFFVSKSGKTLYRVTAKSGTDPEMASGKLPGEYISIYRTSETPKATVRVMTTRGTFRVEDGLTFDPMNAGGSDDAPWIRGVKDAIVSRGLNGKREIEVLAENGIFSFSIGGAGDDTTFTSMTTPAEESKPIMLIDSRHALRSDGSYSRKAGSRSTYSKDESGHFDGAILHAFTYTPSGGGDGETLAWTQRSIYSIKDKTSRIYSSKSTIKEVHVHVERSYRGTRYMVAIFVEGGYQTLGYDYSKNEWVVCSLEKTRPIGAILGVESGEVDEDAIPDFGPSVNILQYASVLYATADGIISPSRSENGGIIQALPGNRISMAAGSHPLSYTISIASSGGNAAHASLSNGSSVWSQGDHTYMIKTASWRKDSLQPGDFSEVTGRVGGQVSGVHQDSDGDYLLTTGDRGLVDPTGARKDSEVELKNPHVVSNPAGGWYIPTDEGLWRVDPGMDGVSGAKTMERDVPGFGKILFANRSFTASEEAAWAGERSVAFPIPSLKLSNLDAPLTWMRPTLALAVFKDGASPVGGTNVCIVQKTLRSSGLKKSYHHVSFIAGGMQKGGESAELRYWDSAAILWNEGSGEYGFFGTKLIDDGSLINYASDETLPSGEIFGAVLHGDGIITKSGKIVRLNTVGKVGFPVEDSHLTGATDSIKLGESGITSSYSRQLVKADAGVFMIRRGSDGFETFPVSGSPEFSSIIALQTDTGISELVGTTGGLLKYSETLRTFTTVSEQSGIKAYIDTDSFYYSGSKSLVFGYITDGGFGAFSEDGEAIAFSDFTGSGFGYGSLADGTVIFSSDGTWITGRRLGEKKIQDLKLKTGISYSGDGLDTIKMISSEGELVEIADDGTFSELGITAEDDVRAVAEAHSTGQMLLAGDSQSWGLDPGDAIYDLTAVVSMAPKAFYQDVDGRFTGKSMLTAGHDGYASVIDRDAYGEIIDSFEGFDGSIILTEKAVLGATGQQKGTVKGKMLRGVSKLIDTDGKDTELIYRKRSYRAWPLVRVDYDLYQPKLVSHDGEPDSITLTRIDGITGKILFASGLDNPGTDGARMGIAVTTDGIFGFTGTTAFKLEGDIISKDGITIGRLEDFRFTERPAVAIPIMDTELYSTFAGNPIICPASADGGGAFALQIDEHGNMKRAVRIADVDGINIDKSFGTPSNDIIDNSLSQNGAGSAILCSGKRSWAVVTTGNDNELSYECVELTEMIKAEAEKGIA